MNTRFAPPASTSVEFIIVRTAPAANERVDTGAKRLAAYLHNSFPAATVRHADDPQKGNWLTRAFQQPVDVTVFIPDTSVHVSATMLSKMVAATTPGAIFRYGADSYARYSLGTLMDTCVAVGRDAISTQKQKHMSDAVASGRFPNGTEVFPADDSCLDAAYARYIEVSPLPITLLLEPSNHCNFKCRMCPYHGEAQADSITAISSKNYATMGIDVIRRVLKEMHDLAPRQLLVVPQLRGEPLLHKDFLDIVHEIKKYPENLISFSTNGALLDEGRSRSLLEAGIDEICISIHAIHEDTARALKIAERADTVMKNVQNFMSLRKQTGNDCRVYIKFVEMAENRDELPEFLDFWLSQGVSGVGVGKENFYSEEHLCTHYTTYFGDEHPSLKGRPPCFQAVWVTAIRANGDMPVCFHSADPNNIVGNINNTSIGDLLNSPKRIEFLRGGSHRDDLPKACRYCEAWTGTVQLSGDLHGRKFIGSPPLVYFKD